LRLLARVVWATVYIYSRVPDRILLELNHGPKGSTCEQFRRHFQALCPAYLGRGAIQVKSPVPHGSNLLRLCNPIGKVPQSRVLPTYLLGCRATTLLFLCNDMSRILFSPCLTFASSMNRLSHRVCVTPSKDTAKHQTYIRNHYTAFQGNGQNDPVRSYSSSQPVTLSSAFIKSHDVRFCTINRHLETCLQPARCEE
jgi:hypothetical protein